MPLLSHVSGSQQEDTPMIQEVVKPQAYGKLLKQKLIDLFVKNKRCEAKESQPISESPIDIFERDETGDFKWKTITYKANILLERHTPILLVFYSSKVSLSYCDLSNE